MLQYVQPYSAQRHSTHITLCYSDLFAVEVPELNTLYRDNIQWYSTYIQNVQSYNTQIHSTHISLCYSDLFAVEVPELYTLDRDNILWYSIMYTHITYSAYSTHSTQYTLLFWPLRWVGPRTQRSWQGWHTRYYTYHTVRTVQTVHTILCYSDLFTEEVPELNALDREVDDGGVLLHKEGVLLEPLDVQDDKP